MLTFLWVNLDKSLIRVVTMPECSQCKFYKPKDPKNGECVNTGLIIPADNDTARCPIRMFVPK